jgi:hypothetical protein
MTRVFQHQVAFLISQDLSFDSCLIFAIVVHARFPMDEFSHKMTFACHQINHPKENIAI